MEEMFLSDVIDVAKAVHTEQTALPVAAMRAQHRFLYRLETLRGDVDVDLWEACLGLCRTVVGVEEGDALFRFPYPHMVMAALALVGRSTDGSNMEHDFADQRELDYPDGVCVPGCEQDFCDHYHQIGAAYARAGRGAMWLAQVVTRSRPDRTV